MKRFVLIGGGGFAKEVAELVVLNGGQVVGYVGNSEGVLNKPYWGDMEHLSSIADRFDAVAVAFGAVDRKSALSRAKAVAWLAAQGLETPSIISPHAIRASGVIIDDGAIVAHGVVMSVDAHIGAFAILNSSAIIGHDAVIGSNTTVAPGAFVGGQAQIGQNSLLGPGTLILEGRKVGHSVVVGVGATVVRDVPDGATVMPLRARVLKGGA